MDEKEDEKKDDVDMRQPNNMCTSGTLKPDAIANYDCKKGDGGSIDNIDDQAACTAAGGTSYTPNTCSQMNSYMGMPQFAAQKETFQAHFGPKCCDGMKHQNDGTDKPTGATCASKCGPGT